METLLSINIKNDGNSYTGEFIKHWCKLQIVADTELKNIALQIAYNYVEDTAKYKLNPDIYYYVDGVHKPVIYRDLRKSPRKYNKFRC